MKKARSFKQKMGLLGMTAVLLTGSCSSLYALPVMAAEETQRTQDGFEMSTAYPGISAKAGETVSFTLDFKSLSGDSYDAALSVESIPEGWSGSFRGEESQISKIHIDGSAPMEEGGSTVSFSLSIPEDSQEGTYDIELKADDGEGNEDLLALEVNVDENETGQGNFTTEYPEQQAASGTSFSFDATLVNNGGSAQSYSLSAEAPSGWMVSFTPSGESSQVASMEVEAGSSAGLTIDVTPPETIQEGEYTIPCTAVSSSETLTTELTVTIIGTYDLSVSTPSGNLSLDAYANAEKSFTLTVMNTGNVDLTNINLSSSLPTDWEADFSESTIDTLEAGATKEVTVNLTPSSDAITGDYVATITASTDEASADASFRVSIKTHTSWGIAAVVIILALLACLGVVFKKYGRR